MAMQLFLNNFTSTLSFTERGQQANSALTCKALPQHLVCSSASLIAGSDHETTTISTTTVDRRSGNYKPTIWDHDFLETLRNDYVGNAFIMRAESLKQYVRKALQNKAKAPAIELLELVDDIQRLGIGYIFEEEIRTALHSVKAVNLDEDLHAVSLRFRLFRQHGFEVSQDVFKVFMNDQGTFMMNLSQDIKGVLSLYEASYLGRVGEEIMDKAKMSARSHLNNVNRITDPSVTEIVNHALELPLHLRNTMLEAIWYFGAYSRRDDKDIYILQLAKLDCNKVQASYQKDAIVMSRWWKNMDLPRAVPFSRDRLIECFFGAMGTACEPQYKFCREGITKCISFINVIDDIYDVYATLDEAKVFTIAIERWDLTAVEELPDYMQLSLLALNNTINEIAYCILQEKGLNVIPYLRKMWVDLCKSYLVEANWYHTGYKPTLEEYLDNAWVSVAGSVILFYTYVTMCPTITTEALEYLANYPDIVYTLCMVLRLVDDMGTYKAESMRGDVLKSIQCYMLDNGVTEEVSLKYIRHLADEAWKKMNTELCVESPLPQEFLKAVVNLARVTKSTYQHGDGVFDPDRLKDKILYLLVDNVHVML